MTYNVFSGTLNPTHSLHTHLWWTVDMGQHWYDFCIKN